MNKSIVVCGQKFDIGTRVVLWDEPNGLNGYNTAKIITKTQNRKTGKTIKSIVSGKRYGKRSLTDPDLRKLKGIITQFFLHHSGLYRSKDTFNVLHNQRGLSVHFILDDDGTLYQCLDLKEKAFHGGKNNKMSIGIEIDSRANADRFPDAYDEAHCKKYNVEPRKKRIDCINGVWIRGYEYTDKQYQTLIRLGICLENIFPELYRKDFPLSISLDKEIIKGTINFPTEHRGFIAHYHTKKSKIDPISFDHLRFLRGIDTRDPYYNSTFLKDNMDIQIALTGLGIDVGPIDGIYGNKTAKAVKEFQISNGLIVDGVCGEKTLYKLDLESKRGK